jgi:hypothetical protein
MTVNISLSVLQFADPASRTQPPVRYAINAIHTRGVPYANSNANGACDGDGADAREWLL